MGGWGAGTSAWEGHHHSRCIEPKGGALQETLPTMCILNDESQPNFNCNASHNKSRRLCPCV